MRISSQQVFDSGVSSMQQHTSDVVKYQQQISSGRKYQMASDDALAAGLGVQIDLDNAQFAMFKVNQNHITASLASTDSQLNNINLALTKFQQMMVQAGNGTLGVDGLKILGQQAGTLYNTVNQMSQAKDANGEQILRATAPSSVLVAPNVSLETALSFDEVMLHDTKCHDFHGLGARQTHGRNRLVVGRHGQHSIGPQTSHQGSSENWAFAEPTRCRHRSGRCAKKQCRSTAQRLA